MIPDGTSGVLPAAAGQIMGDRMDNIPWGAIGEGGESSSMLPSLNLSTSGEAMRAVVSWCRIRSSDAESLSTRPHKHTVHELHYVYEGELRFSFGSIYEPLSCGKGEFIFIPSGVTHGIEDASSFTRKLVIGFEVTTKNELIDATFNNAPSPTSSRGTPAFHELARAVMNKSGTSDLTTSVSIGWIIHALLLEIVDALAINTKNRAQRLRDSEDGRRINQILTFIRENAFSGITVDDVAAHLGLSARQASRISRQLFDCSLNQLIVSIRIKEICTLLTDSKYSISDIAEIAGFSSPYSFSRHFSHYTGVTPGSYRRDFEIHR